MEDDQRQQEDNNLEKTAGQTNEWWNWVEPPMAKTLGKRQSSCSMSSLVSPEHFNNCLLPSRYITTHQINLACPSLCFEGPITFGGPPLGIKKRYLRNLWPGLLVYMIWRDRVTRVVIVLNPSKANTQKLTEQNPATRAWCRRLVLYSRPSWPDDRSHPFSWHRHTNNW